MNFSWSKQRSESIPFHHVSVQTDSEEAHNGQTSLAVVLSSFSLEQVLKSHLLVLL